MHHYNSILEAIGNTPTMKINNLEHIGKAAIYAKLEYFNPGRSVKDRIALNIIEQAESAQCIQPGSVIIESSSGNTGIGLSIVCRVKGYSNVVVTDQNCPTEKIKLLQALGATVIRVSSDNTSGADLTENRIRFIAELREYLHGSFVPNQYENPAAPAAHYYRTAEEIIAFIETQQLKLDAVLISVGTGGTITGISKRLKEYDSNIRIIGIEPAGSTLFGGEKGPYLQQGPGNYFQPVNLSHEHIDSSAKVSDRDAFNMCRRFAVQEGVLLGGSSGAVMHEAVRMSSVCDNAILCILPDSGEKYLDTIYNDEWLYRNNIEIDASNSNPLLTINIDHPIDYFALAASLQLA
ncbi:TPA: PLP-dependent cysteine synthase family protein [Serratia fonticola]